MQFTELIQRNKVVSVLIVIVAVILIVFLSFVLSSGSVQTVPSSFTDARMAASERATELVTMLSGTNEKIREVKDLVERGSHAQALSIVQGEIAKNKDIRERAVRLALELEKMARAIADIRSDKAAQIALSATTKETAVISQLLSYTNELQNLLVALQTVMVSSRPDYTDVNKSITIINGAADEINALSQAYKSEMEIFDKIVQGETNSSPSPNL